MLDDIAALETLARRQHGAFGLRQAEALGVRSHQVDRLHRAGVIVRRHSGVFVFTAVSPTREQALAAACLASDGLVFGRAAAHAWGMRRAKEGKIELLVPHTRCLELPELTVHRTRRLDPADVVLRPDGIAITSPARTLLDYAAYVSWERFETGAFDAIHRQLLGHPHLAEVAVRLGGRGRRNIGYLRAFLDANDPAAGLPESELEVRMLGLLREAGVTGFRMQLHVAGFRLDFPFPEAMLDVEVDGREFHTAPEDVRRDHARDRALRALGWTVLRFSWFDVVYRREWVVDQIRRALTTARRAA